MRPVILIFAKAAVPGRVKTRLGLPPEAAALLHHAFVADTLEKIQTIRSADIELHTDIVTDAWPQVPVPRCLQSPGFLTVKMLYALNTALRKGRPAALIAGSDAPTLPPAYLEELLACQADLALGPTEDGGYYAIMARRTHPALFDGIEISSSATLAQTLEAARRCGLSVSLGREWFDVDTPADLRRLALSSPLPAYTSAALAAISRDHPRYFARSNDTAAGP